MPAIGFGLLWGGYTLLFWGFCRIKGYDIGLAELVKPGGYKGEWPPPLVDDSGGSSDPQVAPGDHPGDKGYENDPNYGGEIDSKPSKPKPKNKGGGSMWV